MLQSCRCRQTICIFLPNHCFSSNVSDPLRKIAVTGPCCHVPFSGPVTELASRVIRLCSLPVRAPSSMLSITRSSKEVFRCPIRIHRKRFTLPSIITGLAAARGLHLSTGTPCRRTFLLFPNCETKASSQILCTRSGTRKYSSLSAERNGLANTQKRVLHSSPGSLKLPDFCLEYSYSPYHSITTRWYNTAAAWNRVSAELLRSPCSHIHHPILPASPSVHLVYGTVPSVQSTFTFSNL